MTALVAAASQNTTEVATTKIHHLSMATTQYASAIP